MHAMRRGASLGAEADDVPLREFGVIIGNNVPGVGSDFTGFLLPDPVVARAERRQRMGDLVQDGVSH